MKLLFCPECSHVFSLHRNLRTCDCGKVSGRYVDSVTAEVNGNGISLAIGNGSLQEAIYSMRRAEKSGDREYFRDRCRVDYCWVRPHEGEGNPHSVVKQGQR